MNLTITEFSSRKSGVGKVVQISWEDFKAKLKRVRVTRETIDEYNSYTNEQRTEIKDVGGYVGGELLGGKRSKDTVVNRTLLTIDADEAKLEDIYDFRRNPCTGNPLYFVHTTHTSTSTALRLRWIFPLLRPVDSNEYRRLISVVSHWVGESSLDASTDQPERLMFWSSVSLDGDFDFYEGGIGALDPDMLLEADSTAEVVPEIVAPYEPVPSSPKGGIIAEGGRNKGLFAEAVSLHNQGVPPQEAYQRLIDFNETRCSPPLPMSELKTAMKSAWRYDPLVQKPKDDFADVGTWTDSAHIDRKEEKEKENRKKFRSLVPESFKSLASRYIAPPTYIVDDLLSTGLTILASPPKYGKSWYCMALALAVASGEDFLGMHTHQNGVVYMALEDGEYRLQDRGLKVNGGKPIPDNFYILNESPNLAEGLVDSLKEMCALYSIGLIIIDTLQKVRTVAGKTEGVYGYDYRELGALQKFAITNNVAVMVVHHLNKGGDDTDFVNRLNGSTGVSGAADTIITLTRSARGDKDTKMSVVGRDVFERTLILRMNWAKWQWENLGEEKDVREDETDIAFRNDPVVKTIVYSLDEAESLLEEGYDGNTVKWSCTSKDLLDTVNRLMGNVEFQTPSAVGMHVSKIANELYCRLGISYNYDVSGSAKRHVFERIIL